MISYYFLYRKINLKKLSIIFAKKSSTIKIDTRIIININY